MTRLLDELGVDRYLSLKEDTIKVLSRPERIRAKDLDRYVLKHIDIMEFLKEIPKYKTYSNFDIVLKGEDIIPSTVLGKKTDKGRASDVALIDFDNIIHDFIIYELNELSREHPKTRTARIGALNRIKENQYVMRVDKKHKLGNKEDRTKRRIRYMSR